MLAIFHSVMGLILRSLYDSSCTERLCCKGKELLFVRPFAYHVTMSPLVDILLLVLHSIWAQGSLIASIFHSTPAQSSKSYHKLSGAIIENTRVRNKMHYTDHLFFFFTILIVFLLFVIISAPLPQERVSFFADQSKLSGGVFIVCVLGIWFFLILCVPSLWTWIDGGEEQEPLL